MATWAEEIVGHLGAAKMQRAPSDDKIIADHIDSALDIAQAAMLDTSLPPDALAIRAAAIEECARYCENNQTRHHDDDPDIATGLRNLLKVAD